MPLTFVLSLAVVLDLSSGLALGFHTRRQADPRELLTLVPFTLAGLALGVYITGRIPDPAVQRATISQMVIVNVGFRVLAFALAGLLYSRALWLVVMLLLPVAWAGVWVGNRVHGSVSPPTIARLIGAALFVTGAALIVRTL